METCSGDPILDVCKGEPILVIFGPCSIIRFSYVRLYDDVRLYADVDDIIFDFSLNTVRVTSINLLKSFQNA